MYPRSRVEIANDIHAEEVNKTNPESTEDNYVRLSSVCRSQGTHMAVIRAWGVCYRSQAKEIEDDVQSMRASIPAPEKLYSLRLYVRIRL